MPECQKIKNGGLDQYGTERFSRLIYATIRKSVGLKGLKCFLLRCLKYTVLDANFWTGDLDG